ncbi:MAG: translation elongation factor Ts [Melioribacteraceae bacterium]|nr:translation elongation factor Ts [Melioribacteraceae bacterium]MCF8264880.1 translation elongation factor Ts [Melioribacteraceae bacterium]MCF8412998.1 translation elongation factor Ts [Melioribacteraceae bacterium]MCF8432681.1 translation elongation factor Ts [Melioribacteraceae bacterium]
MAISAQQVKELRDKTGAGMMDCKKALTEANGDFEKAIEILRKKGASVAAKRAERAANEGIVLTKVSEDGTKAYIVEVNCETDFVAKSDDFVGLSNFILDTIIAYEPQNVEELVTLEHQGKKVQDELTNAIGKIGEKIEVSRFAIENVPGGMLVDYIHHGSKLGVLIKAENVAESQKEEYSTLLKDIAMQAAAMKPSFVNREAVPAGTIEKEIEIYKEIAKKEGKPEQVLERIATGKLNKFYEENCLLEQSFIKDNSKSVGALIEESNKKHSAQSKVTKFYRYHLGDENK